MSVRSWLPPSLLATAAGVVVAAVAPGPAAAQDCPTTAFLAYERLVYVEAVAPADVILQTGAALGRGEVDQPQGEDPCERRRLPVTVVAIEGVDPEVAVAIEGREGRAFVTTRCDGYELEDAWACLLSPLSYAGGSYTGARYPDDAPPRFLLGEKLGTGELAGEAVTVFAIDGVDAAVAVGIADRPSEAFVAPGICPYERFSADEGLDDLLRCLEAPVWFTFFPLGGAPGDEIEARPDRPVPPEADGAAVAVARLTEPGDRVPADLSRATAVGTLAGGAAFTFALPETDQGVYEAIVECPACDTKYGATTFPAGSFALFEEEGGSKTTILAVVVGVVLVLLLVAAVALRRRGYRPGSRRGP